MSCERQAQIGQAIVDKLSIGVCKSWCAREAGVNASKSLAVQLDGSAPMISYLRVIMIDEWDQSGAR